MRSIFTTVVLALFVMTLALGAKDLQLNKKVVSQKVRLSPKTTKNLIQEPLFPLAQPSTADQPVVTPNRLMKTATATHLQVGTSGNGYGWLNSNVRSLDRYAGIDVDLGGDIDFIAYAFRGADASQIYEGEVDVAAGLASGTVYTSDQINSGLGGIGGRYPCMVALDRPFPSFNQYMEQTSSGANTSHPYTVCSYGTYGDNGNLFTTPDFKMDEGWLAPTIQANPLMTQENRLWNGPVAIVKDANDIYRYVGVYENWYSDQERQLYGVQSEKYILTAHSSDTYAADGWVFGWDEGNDPVRIDTAEVSLPRCGVAMNSSGFGVIAGPGHLGWHNPDSGYYYNTIRITYSITTDYGLTWTPWDTVGLYEDLGIPNYIYASEKLIITNIIGTDTIWYEGPAFMGSNFDMSVMVDDNNNVYVGFNSLWGGEGTDGWYPSYKYSGVLFAKMHYVAGQADDWQGSRIAYNNGIWQGDEIIDGMSNYFFDSEVQISKDETGNIYATWLDRRHTDVQVTRFNRYSDPETYGSDATFKTDVYAAHSITAGDYWSDPINLTDSPALDEYELNMSIHSKNQTAAVEGDYGKVWVAYCLADTAAGDPATDAYIELNNAVWITEGTGFNEAPNAIGDASDPVVKAYTLHQNYPNPFNPTTRIEFEPWESGRANLTVYNINGQKIQELFNGNVVKGKYYSFDFDGTNLAAGMYFYRLTVGNHTEVKKMALVK